MHKYTLAKFIALSVIILTFTACGSSTLQNSTNDTQQTQTFDNDADTNSNSALTNTTTIVYEDAEDGSTLKWEVQEGPYEVENVEGGANGSNHAILLRQNWYEETKDHWVPGVSYKLTNELHTNWEDHEHTILELDHKKKASNGDELYCFTLSLEVDTTNGKRLISFNTFYDRENYPAISKTYEGSSYPELNYPLSMDYVNMTEVWQHIRLDLQAYLHQLEPDNNIVSVNALIFEGGDDYLDNIALTSN